MGRRIREHDWAATPLGPPDSWPQALRFALGICLGSEFPTAIYWGPDLRLFYNDAWAPIPAERHPGALGQRGQDVWPEIWDVVGPQFARVVETGEGFATYDQRLDMMRGGEPRETYWNYSFTPIRDEYGHVCGILNQGNETTATVFSQRERRAEVERLHELFQQSPGAVALLHGPEHVFALANPAYLDLTGLPPTLEEIGRRVGAVVERVARGDHAGAAEQFVETVALGRGSWVRLPARSRETMIENAPTFLDEAADPETLALDLDTLRSFDRPVLLTLGDRSPPTFAPVIRRIASALPHAELRTLEGVGHIPHVTHPDLYVAMVGGFVRGHAG